MDGGRGCDRYTWVDPAMCNFQRDLVRDLRDAVWARDEEIARMEAQLSHGGLNQSTMEQSAEMVLKMQDDEIAKLKVEQNGGNNLLIIWIFSVVLAMYCGVCMCRN